MRNTADVTGGKPIAVSMQFISSGDAVNNFLMLCVCYVKLFYVYRVKIIE
jgi:hypothetical protein